MALNGALLLLLSLHPLDLLPLPDISLSQHILLLLPAHLKIVTLVLHLSLPFAVLMDFTFTFSVFAFSNFS